MPGAARFLSVLVPGAWHAGWCWERFAPHLWEAGRTVYTPTLTGLAERATLLTRETDLTTHIADVVRTLKEEDLYHVTLVGHSYGGMVITGSPLPYQNASENRSTSTRLCLEPATL